MAADKLNWVELRRAVMARTGATEKEATAYLNALIETIKTGLRNDKQVRVPGLGTFKLQIVAPRKSVNVVTGEEITIESYSKVIFVPETSVKDSVSQGQVKTKKDPMEKLGQQADEILDILGEIGQGPRKADEADEADESGEAQVQAKDNETPEAEKSKEDKKHERAALLTRLVDYLLLILSLIVIALMCIRYHKEIVELATEGYEKVCVLIEGMRTPAEPAAQEEVFPTVSDSIEVAADTTAAEAPAEELNSVAQAEVQPGVEVVGDKVIYHQFKATEVVRSGSRLTQIARRHYGKQELWVFICDANKSLIPNPDNLNAGITLRIPDLTDELMDLNNPDTKALIQKLQQRCYAKKATQTSKRRK